MPTANLLGIHLTTGFPPKRACRLYTALVHIPKPERLAAEVSEWWRYLGVKQLSGYVFAVLGIIFTVLTAVASGASQLLVALLAVVFQFASASIFAGHGKAHPSLAKRSFLRLLQLGDRAGKAEQTAQEHFEDLTMTLDERHTVIGVLSAELSWIGEGIYAAAADWIAFNEPLNEMINENQRKLMLLAAKEQQAAAATQHDPVVPDEGMSNAGSDFSDDVEVRRELKDGNP